MEIKPPPYNRIDFILYVKKHWQRYADKEADLEEVIHFIMNASERALKIRFSF